MNEQEKHAVSQEERKEKIRARYKGVDRSELEFIPAKQKEKLFENAGAKRVCAYCRVSTDDANQTSSYELQKNHYNWRRECCGKGCFIEYNCCWKFCSSNKKYNFDKEIWEKTKED